MSRKFDSTHEEIFQWWLDEAKAAGLVTVDILPLPYELTPAVKVPFQKIGVTKTTETTRELFKPWTYTPDFVFYWAPEAKGKLFVPYNERTSKDSTSALFWANQDVTGAYYSVIDVKAAINRFGRRDSDVRFPLCQKVVYQLKGVYVQKIFIYPVGKDNPDKTLISATWVPQNYKPEMFYKRDYKRNGEVLHKMGDPKVDWPLRSVIDFAVL